MKKMCPCGSGKQYRKCYLKQENNCTLFLKDYADQDLKLHEEREKQVFKFFTEVNEEISSAVILHDQSNYISQRVRLIILFTLVDVFASYWYEYNLQKVTDGKQSSRFKEWLNIYCLTERNVLFDQNYKNWRVVSAESLYSLRSSIVHFFGLPNPHDNDFVGFLLEPITDDFNSDLILRRLKKNKPHYKPIVFNAQDWLDCIKAGAKLMLEEWMENVKKSGNSEDFKDKHIQGIKKIYEKFNKDGAERIPV